jgi:hypothetical protein
MNTPATLKRPKRRVREKQQKENLHKKQKQN